MLAFDNWPKLRPALTLVLESLSTGQRVRAAETDALALQCRHIYYTSHVLTTAV